MNVYYCVWNIRHVYVFIDLLLVDWIQILIINRTYFSIFLFIFRKDKRFLDFLIEKTRYF